MINFLQSISVAVSIVFLVLVLELVRRRKLTEEYSFLWIGCAVVLLTLSAWREIIHIAAAWLGIFYPPILLLLVLVVFVLVSLLHFSVVNSRHRRQIERLVEDVAILEAMVRWPEDPKRPLDLGDGESSTSPVSKRQPPEDSG